MPVETGQYSKYYVRVCTMPRCESNGSLKVFQQLTNGLGNITSLDVCSSGCLGGCSAGPNVEFSGQTQPTIKPEGLARFYRVGGWKIFGGTPTRDVISRIKSIIT